MKPYSLYVHILPYIISLVMIIPSAQARSPWRKQLEQLPYITTEWLNNTDGPREAISDAHIEPYPLFSIFNKTHFETNKIHTPYISYTEHGVKKKVRSSTLSNLCETLAQEVRQKKKSFTHFHILQKKNFNRRHMCGLLVVKFKKYPFVVKLFVENPVSLVNYWCKGFEPIFFWNMGKGAGRHLCGLTRIRNREIIEERLTQNPFPEATIQLPRKWFWEPENNDYIKITGFNIGPSYDTHATELPGMYAIIADFMSIADNSNLEPAEKKQISMRLCNHLDLIIDPHANNYIFSRNQSTGALTITLIDTEYFPIMVGMKEKKKFSNYLEWYTFLIEKCISDTFYQPKSARLHSLFQPNELLFSYS